MLFSHITDDSFIKVIACNLNWCRYNCTAKRDNCDICCTTTYIYDHIAAWLNDIDTCTDSCCYRLFDEANVSGPCHTCSIFYGLTLNFSYTWRNAYSDKRFTIDSTSESLGYEVLHHLLCDLVITDNALTKRTNCYDVAGCTAEHLTCILTKCKNLVCISVICYNRGLLKYYALSSYINKNTCCS